MKTLLSILMALFIGSVALASQPLFQGKYFISSISGNTNTGWRLIGQFKDSSLLGYGAANAQADDLVYCYSSYGDIDQYRVTNVVSVSGVTLTVDVVYNETGSPRAGAPQPGTQIMCRPGFNGIASYLPPITFDAIPEYLQNGARNLDIQYSVLKMATSVTDYAAVHTNQIGAGLKWDGSTLEATNSGGGTITDPVSATNYVFKFSGEQVLTNGSTISPYANVKISTTNDLVALGTPQIATNGVTEGSLMFIRGAAVTGGITFTNGSGVQLDCKQSFLFGTNDFMSFFFADGVWIETKRLDRKTTQ